MRAKLQSRVPFRVHSDQKPGERAIFPKSQGKPGK